MRGKNKGKTYRGRRARHGSPPNGDGSHGVEVPDRDDLSSSVSDAPSRLVSVPKQVGTDLSFFQSADETVEVSLLSNVLRCELPRSSWVLCFLTYRSIPTETPSALY